MECEIEFDDITVIEAEGLFEVIYEIMSNDGVILGPWVVKTNANIMTPYGVSWITLDLYSNRDIFIVDYSPSVKDVYYNPDLQVLAEWATKSGWHMPKVTQDLAETSINFWQHFRLSGLVESEYLEKRYGRLPEMEIEGEDGFG